MKEERKILGFSVLFNLIVGAIKLVAGFLFHVHTLTVDSIYTFADGITDCMAIVGSKLSSKKPNKYHPYGYGRIEYITNMFIGFFMFIVGGYLFINSFKVHHVVPDMLAISFLLGAIIIKGIVLIYMYNCNIKVKSHLIEDNIEEGKLDIMSSGLIFIVIIVMQFGERFPLLFYTDVIASLFMSCLILKTAYVLVKNNIIDLLGTVDTNDEKISMIKKDINEKTAESVDIKKVELIKYGRYFKIHMVVKLDETTTIGEARDIQEYITKRVKSYKDINIKVVNIDLDVKRRVE